MIKPFDVQVQEPNDLGFGRIAIRFNVPCIYFGYSTGMTYSYLPEKQLKDITIREAISNLLRMIDQDLTEAFRELDKEAK